MKILVINGSPRKKSYTKILAEFALNCIKEKHECVFLDLSKGEVDTFVGFEGKYSERSKKITTSLKDYDVFLICSPVYNAFFSAAIKNLFEHADYKALGGKAAGFIIMAGGKISYTGVQGQLANFMSYFGIVSNPRSIFVGSEAFNKKMNITDKELKKRIDEMVQKTVDLTK